MRDDSYLDSAIEAKTRPASWRAGALTAVGAGLSLVILAGVVTWAYKLGVRDATEIPVIRAEAGLTRVRPEDPGGQVAPHQERAVFEVVTGAPPALPAEPVETLALAPPPETLAEEDAAPIARAPEPAARPDAPAAPEPEAAPSAASEAPPESAAAPELEEAPVDPLAAAVEAAVAEALAEAPDADAAASEDAGDGAPRFAPAAAPRPRPSAPEAAPAAPDAAAVSASAVQIQLGAFESEAVAEAQWAAIRGGNADLLGPLGRAITPVQSGGRTLWRLRAGPFGEVAEAAALCRALALRRQDCIVARAR